MELIKNAFLIIVAICWSIVLITFVIQLITCKLFNKTIGEIIQEKSWRR